MRHLLFLPVLEHSKASHILGRHSAFELTTFTIDETELLK